MPNQNQPAVQHGHRDAIRIVPLHVPPGHLVEAAAPATPPELTYRNGPLLTNVEVFTVFWGAAWNGAQAALVKKVNDFFDAILTSPLIDQLTEYNVAGKNIGHGKRTGSIVVTHPAPHRTVTDNSIQVLLQHEIQANPAFPQPGPNTLYFIYLQPGVSVVQGGSRSCQAFCGYHDAINSQIFYAVMPYPGCTGCIGGMDPFDALTGTSSHELCEAITDAVPGLGWYDDSNGEIGDICAWHFKKVGAYNVQLEWSNKQNKCI
jgi:hypothetical protein